MNSRIINALKIAGFIFPTLVLLALIFESGSSLFKGDWNSVASANFSDGKWIRFFGIKFLFSIGYGIIVSLRKSK
jgi:hypothetical protein